MNPRFERPGPQFEGPGPQFDGPGPQFERPGPPTLPGSSKGEQFQFQLVTPENRFITVKFYREETIGILKVILTRILLYKSGYFGSLPFFMSRFVQL